MQDLIAHPAVSARETYTPAREPSMKREFKAYAASGPKASWNLLALIPARSVPRTSRFR